MTSPRADANYRQRLVQALAVVVMRDGFNGAKIQDIVKEARVSLRTFYAEFPNKEECFLELHRQVVDQVVTLIEDSIVFDKPWRDVMAGGFESYFRVLAAQPQMTHAMFVELATLSPEARIARDVAQDRFAATVVDLVERGRAEYPEIPSRSLPLLTARGILGAMTELVMSRVVRGQIDTAPELVETATDMLWSVVTNVQPPATTGA